jgi:hypothetical protein
VIFFFARVIRAAMVVSETRNGIGREIRLVRLRFHQ